MGVSKNYRERMHNVKHRNKIATGYLKKTMENQCIRKNNRVFVLLGTIQFMELMEAVKSNGICKD